jgi:hypothetical protein
VDGVDALIRIGDQLQRIANVLERLEPTESLPQPGCQHPIDQRLALGASGNGWVCGTCEHVEPATAKVE